MKPRCITRDLTWGTPVPETEAFGKKYCNKVMYNWFDAPIGYISITANYTKNWEEWWKNSNSNSNKVRLIQTMSKDNVVFHSIIFIASLIGTGDQYTLVKNLESCEYLNYQGSKFSKSNHVGVFGDDVMKLELPSDIWRFYLLIQRPETKDTEFKWDTFQSSINSILTNNLGNMVHRVLHFTFKKYDGQVPLLSTDVFEKVHKEFIDEVLTTTEEYNILMDRLKLRDALQTLLHIANLSNKYLVKIEPWKIHKTNKELCDDTIHIMIHVVALLGRLLSPFMPETSKKIQNILNFEYKFNTLQVKVIKNKINKPDILFKKIEDAEIEKFIDMFGN